ncbi:MAG: glycerophosphodiester phosphodiesterase [Eubacteriales bacterium]
MTKILAHRGASGYCPENTMKAFEKALMLSADGLELDIHLTKDQRLVVIHDFTLNRTTNGKGLIKDVTYRELCSLDAGSWFSPQFRNEKIPLLKDVFHLVDNIEHTINIEIKAGNRYYPSIEELILEEIHKWAKCNIILSSFDHFALRNIKLNDPDKTTGILYEASFIDICNYAIDKVNADALHPNYMTLDKDLFQNAKKNCLQINPYTVDHPLTMKNLINLGVDHLITNYPDIALSLL